MLANNVTVVGGRFGASREMMRVEQMNNAKLGDGVEAIDTPALIIDHDLMERNIARIRDVCADARVAWRPHCKAHKCPDIAKLKIRRGAIGITCAKLSEAEAMVEAGITDILIANQIVGSIKIARLVRLSAHARIVVAVDSVENALALDASFRRAGMTLPVLIEIDSGSGRAGVQPGEPVLMLAKEIRSRGNLHLQGLMTWEAHATRIQDQAEKRRTIERAIGSVLESAELCRAAGIEISTVSCGGTGTYETTARIPGVTEIQAGGGILGDVRYKSHYNVPVDFALNLITTVTSRPSARLVITDAGKKAMSMDSAMPESIDLPGISHMSLSAEHGKIELRSDSEHPRIGARIRFAVGCADTTVHLHNRLHLVRNGRIEQIFHIPCDARLL